MSITAEWTGIERPKMDPFDLQVHLSEIDREAFLAECRAFGIKGERWSKTNSLTALYFEKKLGVPVVVDIIETTDLFETKSTLEIEAVNFLLMQAYQGPKWLLKVEQDFDAGHLPEFLA